MLLSNTDISDAFFEAMDKRKKDDSNAETNRLFARAIEDRILAKLASAELPEPAMRTHGAIDTTERHWFTADQLRQAFAQGAASQLSAEPSAWSFKQNKVHRRLEAYRPPDDAYDEGTLVELFTLKEPK